jgi:porphobilinogen deaminase
MALAQSGTVAQRTTGRTGRPAGITGITSFGDASRERLTQIGGTGVFARHAGELDVSASSEMIVVREHGEAMAGDCERLGRGIAARMLSRGAARLMGAPGSVSASAATTYRDDAHD